MRRKHRGGQPAFQPSGSRRVSSGAPMLSGRSPARAATSGTRSDPLGKIGTAAEPGAPTAVPHVNRLKAWLAPPFFSPPAIVWLFRLSRGRKEASAVIPRPDGRPTWFDHACAASRIGSRTDPSHCTPRRYVGVDGTRDWSHPSGSGVHQVHRYSKGASPSMTSPDCPPRLASLSSASEEASSCDAPTIYGFGKIAQVPEFLRFTPFERGRDVDG